VRRAAALAAAWFGAAPLAAQAADTYIVDPAHTFPGFEVAHLGIATQRGRFDRTTGRITLDPEARSGAIQIEIDATSISTGNALLDSLLRGEDFFDVAHHPRIRFESAQVEYEGARPARAPGQLTLLGVTKPVTLVLERFGCTRKPFLVRTTCGADVMASLSRAAFGMSSYAGFIGDEVKLVIQIEAVKQEATPPQQPGS
jgi:polyisoprenoid-binding protein YceI